MTYEKITFKIKGMECASCEVLLERKLKQIEGIKEANVNHRTGKATLIYTQKPK